MESEGNLCGDEASVWVPPEAGWAGTRVEGPGWQSVDAEGLGQAQGLSRPDVWPVGKAVRLEGPWTELCMSRVSRDPARGCDVEDHRPSTPGPGCDTLGLLLQELAELAPHRRPAPGTSRGRSRGLEEGGRRRLWGAGLRLSRVPTQCRGGCSPDPTPDQQDGKELERGGQPGLLQAHLLHWTPESPRGT